MKTRQLELLHILLNHQIVDMSKVLYIYDISKRTLFYDLEEINYHITHLGKIKVENDFLVIDGDLEKIEDYSQSKLLTPFLQSQERKDIILLTILEEEELTLDDYSEKFGVSKSTVFSDVELLRTDLLQDGIELKYNKKYYLCGNEWEIRDWYLSLLSLKTFNYDSINQSVYHLNKEYDLQLSDYSMFYLSELLKFIRLRNNQGYMINRKFDIDQPIENLESILKINNKLELSYINAYILSLSTITNRQNPELIKKYVDELLKEIKIKLVLDIAWNEPFVSNLQNHLMASFYRIKFGFPAINDALKDIKVKYFYLFINIKRIIETLNKSIFFHRMRDEEIGFVAAYIGGYLYEINDRSENSKKIVLVCPQGRVVSLNLKNQIQKSFDNVTIVGTYSINQLGSIIEKYDYIVSTLDLPYYKNVIRINPILSKYDIDRLSNYFGSPNENKKDILELIMSAVEENTKINNRHRLENELLKIIDNNQSVKERQPLLKDIVKKSRIQVVEKVENWKDAINLSSAPLLEEGVIETNYVDAMVNAVEEYGPYIVLADEFALPHASNQKSVKEVAISVLVLRESVDMKGKPVKVFMTLATIDNESHLKALSSLVDIISDDINLDLIKEGNIDSIYELLKGGAK